MIDEKLLIEELSRNSIFEKVTVGEETVYDVINRQPKVGEWIPCGERLPRDHERVLTCDAHGNIHVDTHHHGFKYPFCIYPNDARRYMPVAWMPLPQPYREKVE